ncbi:hypothetical protein SAMN05216389_102171 [Oceanobacillus limi]|uniref:Uncharacterized protein n=1 Tax=Oceanobacillus limi TaxID=930131 RepID=A0A1H9ZCS6_9BACI|nr:hypothetical protein [Oceanobacillus limi]SES78628.1 hypothetical protein SAMN05216389_102171 [Oceanobacillus limi]
MNKFATWFIGSVVLALMGLIIVLNVEDWARLNGELNRSVLLTGSLFVFSVVILSIFCLIKANGERIKTKILLSLFTAFFPVVVFVMNGFLFTIYFIGK